MANINHHDCGNHSFSQPAVDIIVVNWNGWRDTIECVQSLKRIDYDNFRVIIIDNASTDESIPRLLGWLAPARGDEIDILGSCNKRTGYVSLELVDERTLTWRTLGETRKVADNEIQDAFIILLRNKKNEGYAGGNNLGIRFSNRTSNSPYVLLLNNDTTVGRDFLGELVRSAVCHEDVDLLGPLVHSYDDPEEVQSSSGTISMWTGRRRPSHFDPSEIKTNLDIEVGFLSGVAILIRVSVLEEIGLLDTQYFMYTEDIDLSYRVRENGGRVVLVPKSRIKHKTGKSSGGIATPFVTYQIYRNAILFMRKNGRWYNWPSFIIFSSAIALFRVIQAVMEDPKRARSMVIGVKDGFLKK